MSAKPSSSAAASSNGHAPSKLPKFLQGKANRDRSKSVNEQHPGVAQGLSASTSGSKIGGGSSLAASSGPSGSSSSLAAESSKHSRQERRSSKLKAPPKELRDDRFDSAADESMAEDSPVIIETPGPRSRTLTRADRPLSASVSDSHAHPGSNFYHPSHLSHGGRLSDVSTRLTGWFTHAFSSSSTDLPSLPSLLTTSSPAGTSYPVGSSPKTARPSGAGMALLTAARHGKGYLDKGVRYILDSDATPDKCTDPIWLLGVQHPGYEPPPPVSIPPPSGRRSSLDFRRSSSSSFRSSQSSLRGATSSPEPSLSHSTSRHGPRPSAGGTDPALNWPPIFYADFVSRVWLTYRSHFIPIRDHSLAALDSDSQSDSYQSAPVSASPRRWNLNILGGEKGWSSDAGWGCMLRTGQSLLANALVHLHLGRDWRRPPMPIHTADYATYVKIITWFLDSPDPGCPFSVHRMALAGKDLGTDVGQWFGPSTAAGAIKTLVQAFPEAGIGVSVAMDGVLYETDVLAASNVSPYHFNRHQHSRMPTTGSSSPGSHRNRNKRHADQQRQSLLSSAWGQRPVLVLIGVRLGITGVNPIYYDAVKALYAFPQSVGIAGGRPSSSYYFVGSQADSLFYLDPHHARPAVPFRPPPTSNNDNSVSERQSSSKPTSVPSVQKSAINAAQRRQRVSPSPDSASARSDGGGSSFSASGSQYEALDAVQEHYVSAYSSSELRTFHCDRVRKMPMSGLDPSMLLGFLCRDEQDWRDLRARVAEMPRKIFSVQDEPPAWPSDSDDMGLESVSDVDVDIEGPEDAFSPDLDDSVVKDSDGDQEASGSKDEMLLEELDVKADDDTEPEDEGRRQSEDVLTEDDPVGPVTPGANALTHEQAIQQARSSKFTKQQQKVGGGGAPASMEAVSVGSGVPDDDRGFLDDDEEWVAAAMPTPQARDRTTSDIVGSWVDSNSNSRVNLASIRPTPSNGTNTSRTSSTTRERKGSGSKESPSSSRILQPTKSKLNPSRSSSSSKTKTSGTRSKRSSVQSAKEYFPFPVVDDREDDDIDDADEYDMTTSSSDASVSQRQRTGTALRTPVANVKTNDGKSNNTQSSPLGSRIRNARARDGGRTQSGGVKGIVASDLDD